MAAYSITISADFMVLTPLVRKDEPELVALYLKIAFFFQCHYRPFSGHVLFERMPSLIAISKGQQIALVLPGSNNRRFCSVINDNFHGFNPFY